ncbi:MAG: DUF4299 family protein, partial [Erysipelothrix sp.]
FHYGSWDNGSRLTEQLNHNEIIVYKTNRIGRGFILNLGNPQKLELTMNYFATDDDINNVYDFLGCMMQCNIHPILDEDGTTLNNLKDIEKAREFELAFNRRTLMDPVERKVFTIFGVMNPIDVDFTKFDNLSEEETMIAYTSYLDRCQNWDYYYMAPGFFKNDQDDVIMRYVYTTKTVSVGPRKAFLPYGAQGELFEKALPNARVYFVDSENDFKVLDFSLPYEKFAQYIQDYDTYDANHIIIPELSLHDLESIMQLEVDKINQ